MLWLFNVSSPSPNPTSRSLTAYSQPTRTLRNPHSFLFLFLPYSTHSHPFLTLLGTPINQYIIATLQSLPVNLLPYSLCFSIIHSALLVHSLSPPPFCPTDTGNGLRSMVCSMCAGLEHPRPHINRSVCAGRSTTMAWLVKPEIWRSEGQRLSHRTGATS